MDEEYLISETRQLKAVSNPLRMRMLEVLIPQQWTATQLGGVLEMAPSRAHYHLKQLEAAGLCRMVEQRERAGILEKYYRAVASRFRLARTVSIEADSAPRGPTLDEEARLVVVDAVRGYARAVQAQAQAGAIAVGLVLQQVMLRLTPQRYERMLARLRALLLEFDSDLRDRRPGLRDYRLLLMAYPEAGTADGPAAARPAPANENGPG